jgi:hypothetical protein
MPSVTGQDVPSGFDPGANPPIKFGVWGDSGDGAGVLGSSSKAGVGGAGGTPGGAGVFGLNDEFRGLGVRGRANDDTGVGVLGTSDQGTGVVGTSTSGVGIRGSGGQAAAELDGDVRVSATLTAQTVGIGTSTPGHALDVAGSLGQRLFAVDGTTGAVQVPSGAIVPAVGDKLTAGVQFPTDPGGGAGDSAYIRYAVEGGEQTALIIGCENDANDRIVLRQNLKETLVLASGRVGVSTRNPAFDLDVNGTACAKVFCNPSDARLKNNVTALGGVLERLAAVRGVSFTERADTEGPRRRRLGVVAQDVEPAFPELVVPMADGDLRAVDYGGFVGVLVAAVNELSARTEQLTQELASLRAASRLVTP